MNNLNLIPVSFSLLLSTAFIASAHAQENKQQQDNMWGLSIGQLLISAPVHTGSDEYEFNGSPVINGYFNLSEQSTLFMSESDIGLNHQLSSKLSIGILGNVRSEENRSKTAHSNTLSNIDTAFEVGSYLSYQLTNQLEIGVNSLFDVSDTHHGWITNFNASYEHLVPNDSIAITTLAGLNYGSSSYNNTYYGVKSSTENTTKFDLRSGFNSATLGTVYSYKTSENTSLIGLISFTQFTGDAKDSPTVKKNTLTTMGLGVVYTF
jgi:outer membrane scaffolding protein for murein synthesis (MipA/OmpV family)